MPWPIQGWRQSIWLSSPRCPAACRRRRRGLRHWPAEAPSATSPSPARQRHKRACSGSWLPSTHVRRQSDTYSHWGSESGAYLRGRGPQGFCVCRALLFGGDGVRCHDASGLGACLTQSVNRDVCSVAVDFEHQWRQQLAIWTQVDIRRDVRDFEQLSNL